VAQTTAVLLGIFVAFEVLPLDFKSGHNVANLLVQNVDVLKQEAQVKGGI
jgi:hypothetical protein